MPRAARKRVRIDFDLTADRNYKFSIYRTLKLGLDDVTVEMHQVCARGWPAAGRTTSDQPHRPPDQFQLPAVPAGSPGAKPSSCCICLRGGTRSRSSFRRARALLGQTLWLRAMKKSAALALNSTVVVER